MKAHQASRTAAVGPRRRAMLVTLMLGLVWSASSAFGQGMRFFPLRSAPLGSPPGTFGEPVAPEFNSTLGCWELKIPGGVEVDIDVQGFGWGNAPGSPTLGAIQATVISAGYDNGIGAPLNPKGWPSSRGDGWYQAKSTCQGGGDGRPCVRPFDPTCDRTNNGFCVFNPDWIMPAGPNDIHGPPFPTLDYAWATAAQNDINVDDGNIKTFGGLILDVPFDAEGTYLIAMDPDPNNTFMTNGVGQPIPDVVLTPACLTIIGGACCMDTDSDGLGDTCHDDGFEPECVAADGLYLGDGVVCTGIVGACCLDGDGDGFADACRVTDSDCCEAQGGSFLGEGEACAGIIGACCLDSDGDGFADTCRMMDRLCCDTQGGSFRGTGETCAGMVGACCLDVDGDRFPDTWRVMDRLCCDAQGGSFLGAATTCSKARGACTLDSDGDGFQDTCRVMDQTCCPAKDGTFRGAGSPCSATLGACCLDFDRLCVEIDLANCVEQHGRFQGPNSVCQEDGNGSPDGCGEIIPAASQWGLIVMNLVLLVGIKIQFGRLITNRPEDLQTENARPAQQRSPETLRQADGVHPMDTK